MFSDDAITLIHNAARGYARAVNNLAVYALTAAFAAKTAIVDEKSARIAVTEVATTEPLNVRRHQAEDTVTTPTKAPPDHCGWGLPHICIIGNDHDGVVCILSDGQHAMGPVPFRVRRRLGIMAARSPRWSITASGAAISPAGTHRLGNSSADAGVVT